MKIFPKLLGHHSPTFELIGPIHHFQNKKEYSSLIPMHCFLYWRGDCCNGLMPRGILHWFENSTGRSDAAVVLLVYTILHINDGLSYIFVVLQNVWAAAWHFSAAPSCSVGLENKDTWCSNLGLGVPKLLASQIENKPSYFLQQSMKIYEHCLTQECYEDFSVLMILWVMGSSHGQHRICHSRCNINGGCSNPCSLFVMASWLVHGTQLPTLRHLSLSPPLHSPWSPPLRHQRCCMYEECHGKWWGQRQSRGVKGRVRTKDTTSVQGRGRGEGYCQREVHM